MSKLARKMQYNIESIEDIKKALEELGANTDGASLGQYGNIIRNLFKHISSENTLSNKNTIKLNAFVLNKDIILIKYLPNIVNNFVLKNDNIIIKEILPSIDNKTNISNTYNLNKNIVLVDIMNKGIELSNNVVMFSENDIVIKEE